MFDKQVVASPWKTYGVLAIGVFTTSLAAILIRLAQGENVPSLAIAAARLLIAALILSPIALRRYHTSLRQITGRDLSLAGLSGVFLAIHFATWVESLKHTTVLISLVLLTTSPIWVGLLEVFVLKQRLSRLIVIGLMVALAGGIIIGTAGVDPISTDSVPVLGSLLALAGAITFAVYITIGRKLRGKLPVIPYIWLVYGCAAIILSCAVLVSGIPVYGYSARSYLWLIALALIPQLVGHSSLNYAVGFLPATYVTIAIQLEPVASALFAFFLFREVPGSFHLVGSGIILIGVMLASLGQSASD
jgi:drug/metabolite transporter (DMT)-like permease